jgi:hypothetical protein
MSEHDPRQPPGFDRRALLLGTTAITAAGFIRSADAQAQAATGKPNILVIMADDIGWLSIGVEN